MTDIIDGKIDALMAAWEAKDIEKVLAMYSEDICYGTNNGEIVKGKDKFRPILAALIEKYSDGKFKHVSRTECKSDGKGFCEMGNFSCNVRGTSKKESGKYMSCFENRDGNWLCTYDLSMFC